MPQPETSGLPDMQLPKTSTHKLSGTTGHRQHGTGPEGSPQPQGLSSDSRGNSAAAAM